MSEPQRITTPQGRTLAYHVSAGQDDGRPGIVFLGGLNSDMQGTKAVFLEEWCRGQGLSFLRFDYSGHGQSSNAFTDGCIGDWAEDAEVAITELTSGPQILVGSSMGGWVSLLMTRRMADRIAGLVTIAAAPDFTEDSMWASFDREQRAALQLAGRVALPSDYGAPYVITRRLIEDGRDHLLLRDPLPLPFPVRFFHGTADRDVDLSVALRLMERAEGPDIRLCLVKDADHRFSTPDCLDMIAGGISDVLARI